MQPQDLSMTYRSPGPRSLSVDGLQHRKVPQAETRRPLAIRPTSPPNPAAAKTLPSRATARPFQKVSDVSSRPSRWKRLQLPLVIALGMLAGFFAQSLWFGVPLIVLYGILSFVFHVKSRVTFTLATIALASVIIIVAAGSGMALANTFSTYSFLLLTIGVIALSIEARPQKRRKRHRGR